MLPSKAITNDCKIKHKVPLKSKLLKPLSKMSIFTYIEIIFIITIPTLSALEFICHNRLGTLFHKI